jgi:addiction module HigA family antidote
MSAKELMTLVPPGEILAEEFLVPLGISEYRLAKDTGIPASRINEIVHGRRAITADTALRLGQYFGMEPEFWMNLQTQYDLDRLRRQPGLPKVERCPQV